MSGNGDQGRAVAAHRRVQADDQRRARLNCISHLLGQIPYEPMDWQMPDVGKRKKKPGTPESVSFHHEIPAIY